jgi:hypothetical protein
VFKIGPRYLPLTSVVNSHTETYKRLAPADKHEQLQFICSGHNDYYIDLNSLYLILLIKQVKTDGSDLESFEHLVVWKTCCIQCLVLSVCD